MKTTAKPTPGPWRADAYEVTAEDDTLICNMSGWKHPSISEANAALIAEAGTVHHETGLTPREILAQRDDLSDSLQREIAVNKCILTLIEQAYDRFTDNDMVPPNHLLEKWLAKARVCMTHAASTESRAAIQNVTTKEA